MAIHHVLKRQIDRYIPTTPPEEWQPFFEAVSRTYTDFDEDRILLNRSLELSSKEFLENSLKVQEAKRKAEELADNLAVVVEKRTVELANRVQELEDVRSAMINLLDDYQKEQKALAESKAKDDALLESIGEGVIAIDRDGKVIIMNKAAENLLGYSSDEILGKVLTQVIKLEDDKNIEILGHKQPIIVALGVSNGNLNTSEILNEEDGSKIYYYVKKNQTKLPVSITVSPVMLENEVIGGIEVFRDITKEQEIDKAKTEFVSITSHALRTPLTAIDGLVSMILDGEYGPVNDNLKEPLGDVNTSSERLILLVNDLLNLSRIQAGKLTFDLSEFLINEVIVETVQLMQPLFEKKGLNLVVGESDQLLIQSDPDKIKEILNNLIGNSLKFTDKGGVTVSVKQVNDSAVVYVTDTGIGIEDVDQGKVFVKFKQLESSKGRSLGTGLGLYISKEVVEKMGGKIWIESSEVGKGTTFAFSLPIAKSALAMKVKTGIDSELLKEPVVNPTEVVKEPLVELNQ